MSSSDNKKPAKRHQSVLKRTTIRPGPGRADAADSVYAANRLTALTHELSNLLDGSIRCLGLALRAANEDDHHPHSAGDERALPRDRGELMRRLTTVKSAMEQMAGLVRSVHMGHTWEELGDLGRRFGFSGTLAEAIEHAADVMRPLAEERSIRIRTCIGPELEQARGGALFTVISAAIRNSIESIERAGRSGDGVVSVDGWTESRPVEPGTGAGPGGSRRWVVVEVTDNGAGPPKGLRNVFDMGTTSKTDPNQNGAGVGLAVAKQVLDGLHGVLSLTAASGGTGRGAVLRLEYPLAA